MKQNYATIFAANYHPHGYKELLAYQLAFNEAMRLHWLLPNLPEEESPLVAKLREVSREVCMHLAAAWEQRHYKTSFVAKLSEAKAAAAKVQTWVAFAVECGYLCVDDGRVHCDLCGDVVVEIEDLIRTALIVVRLAG
ncbi:four helix bundle protein [cf. Phormidesmis sp. LEGE 11477]|uniref:four helix bundle protein n=1 Tax=cf. Phormidesmis sp. LEGE 11477 TaxID=1828680 RepID=UPI0018819459|nr:four helix bundle protein [cf. Phormidesmis sp. LEGE 11477]MBE9064832.1 four helix bundle protein [cf. Phormidesmis sp. LEGE 11477]